MADPGDTITYTAADGDRVDENISAVDEIEIEYVDASAGGGDDRGFGGRVEDAVADVSDFDTLYIWVSDGNSGRYSASGSISLPGGNTVGRGGGSSEVSVSPDEGSDTDDAPFIVGSAGGGGGDTGGGNDGARTEDQDHVPPPLGGEGAEDGDAQAGDGEGSVSGHGSDVPIISDGTTITGGGSTTGEGEIRITYKEGQDPPEPPENLTAELL